MTEIRRLFFGLSCFAPWPEFFPEGRIIPEENRHITLAFLGNIPFSNSILDIPKPTFPIGSVAQCDQCLFLPPHRANVVAWHLTGLHPNILQYQQELSHWLKRDHSEVDARPFLPHVTIARAPFAQQQWEESFLPLPCMVGSLHLYESKGNLQYLPLWTHTLLLPFEELEHTADIAYLIRGVTLEEIDIHAHTALSFRFPPFLSYYKKGDSIEQLDVIIMRLNDAIMKADAEIGCPFKAVSFHGNIKEEPTFLTWEMIVDV